MPHFPLPDDIAIIGMACVLPGAKDASAFWSNILAKRNFIQDAPDEWVNGKFEPDSNELDRIYTRKVGLLGELAEFDPLEFGIVPNALPATEPDHFLALKMAARALSHAGYADKPFDRSTTGIILGRGATPNRGSANGLMSSLALDQVIELLGRILPELDAYTLKRVRDSLRSSLFPLVAEAAPGLVSNVAVGRIANRLDLQGPTFLVDAACSSTLIAVDLAMKELRSGQSRMMLAGGVQASMPPQVYMLFCQLNALSRNDARPFDKRADGTILSEGAGFLVLKRLADAETDGDRIYAVLKAAGIASDGRAQGLLTPRVEGEALAVKRAYAQCNIDTSTVDLIEAHGTGIPLGDRTEVDALRMVFGEEESRMPRHALGSVKSMIGHCIPAAGIASLIKTALALHYKILPPTLCEQVQEELRLEESPFYINTEPRPWIRSGDEGSRRAGINAFGFGGINAHIILEEYPSPVSEQVSAYDWLTELLVVSAESPDALSRRALEVRETLTRRPEMPLAISASALGSEPAHECRLAIVARGTEDAITKLESAAAKIAERKRTRLQTRTGIFFDLGGSERLTGKTVFLFPGQGSQYPNMMADLCMAFPEFRHEFDASDAAFAGVWKYLPSQHVFPPPTCLKPGLADELNESYLSIDVAMETIFTANIAMFKFLQALGLRCDMMVGHSTGEYTALAASGAVRVPGSREGIELKRKLNRHYRNVHTADRVPCGSLLTVGAVEPENLAAEMARFEGRVRVAMDNCPHQKILFGQPEDVNDLASRLKSLGGVCQVLPFNRAYHTPEIELMKDMLLDFYAQLPITTPKHRLISCSSLGEFPTDPAGIRALSASQWYSPVRFRETIERLYDEEGVRFFVEVGPSAHLTAFVEDTLRKREFLAVATNDRSRSGLEHLQRTLAQLWCRGFDLDFGRLYRRREPFISLSAPSGKPPSKANKPLEVLMPHMHLRDDLVTEVRRKAGLNGNSPSPRPVKAAAKGIAAPAASSTPQRAPVPSASQGVAVLMEHQRLMQEFLASQQRTIEALLDGLGSRPEV